MCGELVGSRCIAQGAQLVLCDNAEGWGGGLGGRLQKEEMYVSTELIHFAIQQELTSHCKAIMCVCVCSAVSYSATP